MDVLDRWRRRAGQLQRAGERFERAGRRAWRRANTPGVVVREGDRLTVLRNGGYAERLRVASVGEPDGGGRRLRVEPVPDAAPPWLRLLMDQVLGASARRPGSVVELVAPWDVPPRRDRPGGSPGSPSWHPVRGQASDVASGGGFMQFLWPSPMGYARRAADLGQGRPYGPTNDYLRRRYGFWTGQAEGGGRAGAAGGDRPAWLRECVEMIVRLYRPVLDSVRALVERLRAEQAARLSGAEVSEVLIDEASRKMRAQPIVDAYAAGQVVAEPVQSRVSPAMQDAINAAVQAQVTQDALRRRYQA